MRLEESEASVFWPDRHDGVARPCLPLIRHVRFDRPGARRRAAPASLSLAPWGCCRTTRPLPQRQALPSVMVCSACPARRSASRTGASRSPSAVSTATARASSRRSRSADVCAAPPGHPTMTVASLASHLPHRRRPFHKVPKQLPTTRAVITDDLEPVSRTPSRFQNPMCHTPDAPPEVARVGLTAGPACTPLGGCDDEPA
jgi:hypothetical protein